ncbi:hypothetical protein AAFF_G00016060 [Aldrovandia affinis]|uniref:Uncharacterized protein n=1 Tax=Aldrovandia affinis TaxID=143900 RepID=A0AAD7WH87_9TELE|nr:hypothetical protein AAFF_G00016060 [Aldrovandia affinis]
MQRSHVRGPACKPNNDPVSLCAVSWHSRPCRCPAPCWRRHTEHTFPRAPRHWGGGSPDPTLHLFPLSRLFQSPPNTTVCSHHPIRTPLRLSGAGFKGFNDH